MAFHIKLSHYEATLPNVLSTPAAALEAQPVFTKERPCTVSGSDKAFSLSCCPDLPGEGVTTHFGVPLGIHLLCTSAGDCLEAMTHAELLGVLRDFGELHSDAQTTELRSQIRTIIAASGADLVNLEKFNAAKDRQVRQRLTDFFESVGVPKRVQSISDLMQEYGGKLSALWQNLSSQYFPDFNIAPPPCRRDRKVLVIGPGFGAKQNPAQILCIEQAGYQVRKCWLDNPEDPKFDLNKSMKVLQRELSAFKPDVVACASKGGRYMIELWSRREWVGASLMINVHPSCQTLPKDVNVVLAHGSNDETFPRDRKALSDLVRSGTPGKCFLYFSGSSGPLPKGGHTRTGDGHNMKSLLKYMLLPRLLDAACSDNPELHMMKSWQEFMDPDRCKAEQELGFVPDQLRQYWASTRAKGLDDDKLFEVPSSTREYECVAQLFRSTTCVPRYYKSGISDDLWRDTQIDKIERIENGAQQENSEHFWGLVRRLCGGQIQAGVHVRWAFHGASVEAYDSIIHDPLSGFNAAVAGQNLGALWGKGTYFARDAQYPVSHDLCGERDDGAKQILLCLLVTGWPCLGDHGQGLVPYRHQRHRYDSVVDCLSNPEIFVVQNTGAAYPAYLITFS